MQMFLPLKIFLLQEALGGLYSSLYFQTTIPS